MNTPLRVLITGTNKGIGNELVKQFLKKNPDAQIFATSREQEGLAIARWKDADKENRVKCMYLDVTSEKSIKDLTKSIEKEKIKIDILINNAGVSKTQELYKTIPSLDFSKECLNINVLGPINLTQELLPFLSDTAKVVNVSSLFGGLILQPESAQKRFSDPKITKQDITTAVQQYISQNQDKNLISFSPNVYATSKMLLGAWSRFINQKKWLKKGQVSICVTPGLCLTSMTNDIVPEMQAKAFTAESGASKIHETIFFQDLDPNVFYHRARRSDFFLCGQGLPWE